MLSWLRFWISKKGLSNVIASVMLILAGISAVVLLGGYLFSLLSEPDLSPVVSCIEMQSNPGISIVGACYDNRTGDVEIRISRRADDFDLDNFYLSLESDNGEVKRWCCGEECESCDLLEKGGSRTYYVSAEGNERSVSLDVFSCVVGERKIREC